MKILEAIKEEMKKKFLKEIEEMMNKKWMEVKSHSE